MMQLFMNLSVQLLALLYRFIFLSISVHLIVAATSSFGETSKRHPTKSSSSLPPSVYPVDEYIFHATIDHYNFRPTVPYRTFPLRYYVNEQYYNRSHGWQPSTGPVFFYAGNEADIFQFVNNSGFLFEAAEEFGAMVVFAEHRYYGLSNPFGNEYALDRGYNISFLTVEQAMQDFNTLTVHIRQQWEMDDSQAFVVFGGSYGANLALWLRLKNPNLWAGAIASSATPLKHILRTTNDFARIETEAYGNVSAQCPELVRRGWMELFDYAKTQSGRELVATTLSLCNRALPTVGSAYDVYGWISGALETMVQYGYPYPTTFYNPVPGYPFKVACEAMLQSSMSTLDGGNDNQTSGLRALKAAANVYYNYTGQAGICFDVASLVVPEASKHWQKKARYDRLEEQRVRLLGEGRIISNGKNWNENIEDQRLLSNNPFQDPSGSKVGDGEDDASISWTETNNAWGYQTCTEAYQPMPTNGVTDLELPYQPNQTEYFMHCWRQWGVVPRPNWEELTFMGSDIGTGSNIFLTNGQLDPWRAAGIQDVPRSSASEKGQSSIIVRTLEGAAHHLDLRASHPLDPPSVKNVRKEQKEQIRLWIDQWKRLHPTR